MVVSKVLADSGHSYLVSWLNQNSQGVTEYTVMYRKIPVSWQESELGLRKVSNISRATTRQYMNASVTC